MKIPRMSDWLLIAAALAIIIAVLAPQQLPVSLYKLSLVSLAAVVGYWSDRSAFPYARPDTFDGRDTLFDGRDTLYAASMIRRAIIMAAAMVAVSLGA